MSSQIKSHGSELTRLMNAIGLPEELGEIYGKALNRAINNDMSVVQHFLNAFTGLTSNESGRAFFCELLPDAGYISHPRDVFEEIIRLDKEDALKHG